LKKAVVSKSEGGKNTVVLLRKVVVECIRILVVGVSISMSMFGGLFLQELDAD
jgi:hypothetical protein